MSELAETESYGQEIKLPRSYGKNEKRRILKNVIVIGFAFMLLFTASASMNNLQSSINSEDGLGVYSQATANTAVVLSSLLLPKFLIYKLTAKWTMVLSILLSSVYIAVQFRPTFYTMLPAGFVVGLVSVTLWSAKCTYLTHIGQEYATLSLEKPEVVIVRFFGIFFLLFQCCQIWGNLISSAVLSSADDSDSIISDEALEKCGASFCVGNMNSTENANLERPSDLKIYTLASIYLVIAICAALVVVFLVDPLTRYGEREREQNPSKVTNFQLLIATFYQMLKPKQLLLIPLTVWSGLEQGFFSADFTQAYVSCSIGVGKLGLVFICFGVSDAIASVGFGQLIKYFGRIPIFILGTCLNIAIIVLLFNWRPNPDNSFVLFLSAGVWGIADAIWQTQINALYGVLFRNEEEAAFSNYRLWESVGFLFVYIANPLICIYVKLWILVGVLGVGMLGYLLVELGVHREKNAISIVVAEEEQ